MVFNGLTLMCVESGGGSDWETAKTWNFFGDPSVQARTATPLDLTLSNTLIMVGIPFTTVVTSSEGPVENAMVTLSQDEQYFTGITDAYGSVTIEQTLNPGNAKLVVTGFNTETIYENQSVIPPNGPYIAVASVTIGDAEGNGNGLMDYGEDVYLTVGLVNVGTSDATNVTASIFTTDEYVSIIDDAADFGTIPAGDTVFVTDAFKVLASNAIPDLHFALFDLSATDDDTRDTWISSFTLTGHAPVLEMAGYSIDDASGNNNGRLDPGETVLVTISTLNAGSADAYIVSGSLASTNGFITISNSPLAYGDILAGQGGMQAFEVVVSEDTPTGDAAQFLFDLEADMDITGHGEFVEYIGQIPVLLLDWDANHNSPSVIEQCLNNLEVGYDKMEAFPDDRNLYASIFVCLGTYAENHVLTAEEGQVLADYLEDGGNLFMEGADTWYYDPQYTPTPVHAMFNILGTGDGGSELSVLAGQPGTLAEGMSYTFSGDNSYIDHIEPIPPAQMLFMNTSPSFGAAVSYDAGTYRTVGFSFELGGLQDGDKNKDDLMIQILEFFNIEGIWTDVRENDPLVSVNAGSYPNPFRDETVIRFEIQKECRALIGIYNINGQLINRLYESDVNPGIHEVSWDGTGTDGNRVADGMYFYCLQAGNELVTGKLMRVE